MSHLALHPKQKSQRQIFLPTKFYIIWFGHTLNTKMFTPERGGLNFGRQSRSAMDRRGGNLPTLGPAVPETRLRVATVTAAA